MLVRVSPVFEVMFNEDWNRSVVDMNDGWMNG